jgi:hypothetical protein
MHRYANSRNDLTRNERAEIVQGYDQRIWEYVREGKIPYYLNFLFRPLPGGQEVRKKIMTAEVERVHKTLTEHVVRKSDSDNWKHLRPIFVGCHDLPVWKHEKELGRAYVPNDGLHFNLIALMPPTNPLPPGMDQHPLMPKQSRLHVCLEDHFEEEHMHYLKDPLNRIHVTAITAGTMADYALKTFKHGCATSDDILILT